MKAGIPNPVLNEEYGIIIIQQQSPKLKSVEEFQNRRGFFTKQSKSNIILEEFQNRRRFLQNNRNQSAKRLNLQFLTKNPNYFSKSMATERLKGERQRAEGEKSKRAVPLEKRKEKRKKGKRVKKVLGFISMFIYLGWPAGLGLIIWA